jgi:glycosyltransferase involved in cell wall biosynthesis
VKILLSSYVFSPSVGGIETVSALLAPAFLRAGHEVTLITHTKREDGINWGFPVHRKPSPAKMMELVRWCDVYFQNNISLTYAWPLLLVRRPWVIAHHTWIGRFGQHGDWRGQLKRLLLKLGTNATISRAIAQDIPVESTIVGNPYSDHVFTHRPEISRSRELVYLGRLVSDKGVDLLMESLVELRGLGLVPHLTIIGSGPEEATLRQMAHDLGVNQQVEFTGSRGPHEIARILNAHQVLVVPSRWPEPFGIVALEGIASGCVVVASRAGGLPDVVGPCGVTFEMGDQSALTESLSTVLTHPDFREKLLEDSEHHLEQFRPATVAAKYLRVFARAMARG